MKNFFILFFTICLTLFANPSSKDVLYQKDFQTTLEKNNLKLEIFKNTLQSNVNNQLEKQNIILDNTVNQIDTVRDRIDNISGSIDRFGIIIAFFGVLVTLLVIYFSLKSTSEARAEIQNWINDNGEKFINKELKPIKDSFTKNIEKMEEELKKIKEQSNLEIEQLKRQLNEKGNEVIDNLSSKISENEITTNELSFEDKKYFELQIKAIKYKPTSLRTFQDNKKIILYYIANKDYKKTVKFIDKLLKNDYTNEEEAWLLYLKGMAYEKQYDYDNALNYFNDSIKLFPNFAKAYTVKAKIYNIELQDYEEARKLSDKAIKLDNQNYDAYIAKAFAIRNKAYYEKKPQYYKEAIEINKQAININEDLELAYNNIGSIYRMQNDYENAEKWYKKSIKANPNDWVYNNLFIINLISNKPFDKTLEQDYLNQFKNTESKNYAIYQMLKILQNIKNNKVNSLGEVHKLFNDWENKYTLRHFTFVALKNWANNEKNEKVKELLQEAVELFKENRIKSIFDTNKEHGK
jgi:tetratricopeptide (TPR) repeat protein